MRALQAAENALYEGRGFSCREFLSYVRPLRYGFLLLFPSD
jgi:hypothetical protein